MKADRRTKDGRVKWHKDDTATMYELRRDHERLRKWMQRWQRHADETWEEMAMALRGEEPPRRKR